MRRRDRFLAIAAVLLIVATIKVGQQIIRWYAFADERSEIARVEQELEQSALGVIATQIEADSLRRRIEAIDSTLEEGRGRLDRLERDVATAGVRPSLEVAYRRALEEYNSRVGARNELFREWRRAVNRNHQHVDLYNLLADSVRRLADQIGEPYYSVLSPAEIAERRGLIEPLSTPR